MTPGPRTPGGPSPTTPTTWQGRPPTPPDPPPASKSLMVRRSCEVPVRTKLSWIYMYFYLYFHNQTKSPPLTKLFRNLRGNLSVPTLWRKREIFSPSLAWYTAQDGGLISCFKVICRSYRLGQKLTRLIMIFSVMSEFFFSSPPPWFTSQQDIGKARTEDGDKYLEYEEFVVFLLLGLWW